MSVETQTQAFTLAAGEGRALWHLDALLIFKALGAETEGDVWAFEGLADRRMAVPLHSHSREAEIWYVLEGEIEFVIGDERRILQAGAFAYVPRNVPHSFRVRSETARWFGLGIRAGFDEWFFETGQPAPSLTLPPLSTEPPDVGALVASLERYGTDTLGPPPMG
jgi:mannose-6-phosphate isomerase-like protein (cupin superfamily)